MPAQLHVEGWPNYGSLRLDPQMSHPENGEQEFWNVIQLAGNELQPDIRAQVLVVVDLPVGAACIEITLLLLLLLLLHTMPQEAHGVWVGAFTLPSGIVC